MISINATLIIQIIHIIILIYILNRLMFRPILKLIKERSHFFDNTRDEITNLEQETEKLKKQYISVQNDARKNAAKERDQLKNQGLEAVDGQLNETRKEASAIRADADSRAEQEMTKSKPMIAGEAAVLADDIIEIVIGRRV